MMVFPLEPSCRGGTRTARPSARAEPEATSSLSGGDRLVRLWENTPNRYQSSQGETMATQIPARTRCLRVLNFIVWKAVFKINPRSLPSLKSGDS